MPRELWIAKGLISAVALVIGVGSFVADWNQTHVFNPDWPPHARFHVAHQVLNTAMIAGVSLVLLWGAPLPSSQQLIWSALLSAFYLGSLLMAPLVPGTAVADTPAEALTESEGLLSPLNLAVMLLMVLAASVAIGLRGTQPQTTLANQTH